MALLTARGSGPSGASRARSGLTYVRTRTYVTSMRMTATELRSRLYTVLDQIAETGEPVEIVRKGKTLEIKAKETRPTTFSSARLVSHPGTVVGNPDDLVHMDWSREWKPFGGGK